MTMKKWSVIGAYVYIVLNMVIEFFLPNSLISYKIPHGLSSIKLDNLSSIERIAILTLFMLIWVAAYNLINKLIKNKNKTYNKYLKSRISL
ncbi:hypothetical protein AKUH1B104J_00410 [Apilactobacillus kunkeei]|nr:hypothetical protein AKUH1B104J_00410 [Apilactobacillus kunkeei]